MEKPLAICTDYLIIFWNLLTFFFATFFSKVFFFKMLKSSLNTRKPFKTTLLNEKQSNLEKEINGNISFLYSQYFLPGAGSNAYILLLLKTNEKVFYFNFLDQKSSI